MSNKECPQCRINDHDSDGSHMFLMSDGKFWMCNRAEYHESGQPYYESTSNKVEETVVETIEEVMSMNETNKYVETLQQTGWLRNVAPDTLQKFGARYECAGDGTPSKHFYPIHAKSDGRVLGYEVRVCDPKSFYKTVTVKSGQSMLGGQVHVPAKPEHLIITEGFIDAMTLEQTLHSSGLKTAWVVSLNNGANLSSIKDNIDFLKSASNVYLYADQDEPGQKIVRDVALLLPTVRIMKTSEKDADEMVTAGKSAELIKAFKIAERWKPESIVNAAEAKAEAMLPVEEGLSYPFKGLTELTYGIRPGRLIGLAAGPGAGKSQIFKAIQIHLIQAHNERVGVFALEENPAGALRELAGYVMNLPLDRPDCVYDPKKLARVIDSFGDKIVMYNVENYSKWLDIEEAIRYMASDGVKYFFIDPVSVLTAALSSADANMYLNEAFWNMSRMVTSMGISIYYSSHLNNPSSGRDAAEGGAVRASQMTGSRAAWKYSTDVFGSERDQYHPDPEVRNTTTLVNLKYRKPSKPGKVILKYDDTTGTLREQPIMF